MTSTFTLTGRLLDDSKQPLKRRTLTLHAYPSVRSDEGADETYVEVPPLITDDNGYICRRVDGEPYATPGVALLAGPDQQYSIRAASGNLRSPLRFDAPTSGTLDLSSIVPAPPTPPATWQTWAVALGLRLDDIDDQIDALRDGADPDFEARLSAAYGPGGTAGNISKPTAQGVALVQALIYGG